MGQHNSFGKDMELLAEAYGGIVGGAHVMQGMGVAAQQAAGQMSDEDGEDKTGHLSDKDLLAKVKDEGTAGKGLLDAAKARVGRGESLTPDERDALARDAYEGNEDKIWSQEDSYEQNLDKDAEAEGGYKPGHPAN